MNGGEASADESAKTMSDDNIFREVDEDLRREQMAALWDKYGVYVLGVAALIIVVVAGYNIYTWRMETRAAETGEAFHEASRLIGENKTVEASAALAKLLKSSGDGYRALANLEMAALDVKAGRKAEAIELYDKVSRGAPDPILRDFAKIQATSLLLDEAGADEIRKRVGGLNTDKNPWRHSAQELLGLAAFRSGEKAESEKIFSQILGDPSAPAEIRRRAEVMLALLVKAPEQTSAAPGQKGSQTQ